MDKDDVWTTCHQPPTLFCDLFDPPALRNDTQNTFSLLFLYSGRSLTFQLCIQEKNILGQTTRGPPIPTEAGRGPFSRAAPLSLFSLISNAVDCDSHVVEARGQRREWPPNKRHQPGCAGGPAEAFPAQRRDLGLGREKSLSFFMKTLSCFLLPGRSSSIDRTKSFQGNTQLKGTSFTTQDALLSGEFRQ